jgi:hypothetical protein
MLERQKGVAWSRSSYPEGTVVVKFDPEEVTGASLRAFINGMGFAVEDESAD